MLNRVSRMRVVSDVLRTKMFETIIRNSRVVCQKYGHKHRILVDVCDHVGARAATRGYYDGYRLEAIKELFSGVEKPGGSKRFVALDIGGNIGNHAVFMSDLFDKVISFEPIPGLAKLIDATATLNNIKNISVIQVALSDTVGEATIYYDQHNAGASSLEFQGDESFPVSVNLKRGDEVLDEFLGQDDIVGFVKIDVEGHEVPALQGLIKTLSRHKPPIWFESHSKAQTDSIMKILGPAEYKYLYQFGDPIETKSGLIRGALGRAFGGMEISLNHLTSVPDGKYLNYFASTKPLFDHP